MNIKYSLHINCKTWRKDNHELIDYDSRDLSNSELQINSEGYIMRSENNNILFSQDKNNSNELLLQIKKDDNSHFEIVTNDYQLDENKNIQTNNNSWFLFRKSIQGQNFKYKIKQGDILRFGRITCRIKEIVFNKNLIVNELNNNLNENIMNEHIVNKSGEMTLRKPGFVSKINSLKVSSDIKKINLLNINSEKKDRDKKNEALKVAQTIPVDFVISVKKKKLPRLCKVCYNEEENPENPLVQPCHCSGSLKYIHLDCLKQWLNTKSCIKMDGNDRFISFLVKPIECEICKTKFPDFIRHKDKLYEILEPNIDFESYCFFEILTLDKDGKRYIYVINLDKNFKLKLGRGHEANLTLSDISVSRVHSILTVENKKIFLEDNDSKFGTLILVQSHTLKLIEDLPLYIQVGRTFLDCKIKKNSSFFLCCGVSEKPDLNYYFQQNEEKKKSNLLNMFTIKSELDYSEEYDYNEKEKINVFEEEKNNENNIVNEVNTFYDNEFIKNSKIKDKIQFQKEETFVENRKSINNEVEKSLGNKDNNIDNNGDNNIEENNNIQEKVNEIESIILESESENPSS